MRKSDTKLMFAEIGADGPLVGISRELSEHEADRLFDAFMFVDHPVGPRVRTQAFVNPREGRVGDMIRGAPNPRFERGAGKP